MKDYIPLIGIILILGAGYFGFNKLITNQATESALNKQLREQNIQLLQLHAKENKVIDSVNIALKRLDTLMIEYNEKLNYIEKQNNALFDRYNDLPPIKLPEL